jgi:hypothetical protein
MGNRKKREPGPQRHAEGQHGDKTHGRFIEQLHASPTTDDELKNRSVEGHHRLHEDRQQHDEAEKNSEKVEAQREIERRNIDEMVIAHARIPPEGLT